MDYSDFVFQILTSAMSSLHVRGFLARAFTTKYTANNLINKLIKGVN